MAKMGPKFIEIEVDKMTSLMRLSPTLEDTANFFQCSADTIERFIKRKFSCTYAEFRDKNAVHTRMSIKRKMIEKALAGDNTMLIWLSKNMLGMSDKVEQKVAHSGIETLPFEEIDRRYKEAIERAKKETKND